MTMKNGEEYSGQMLDNLFHGDGEFTFADDDKHGRKKYVGKFENGHFHGKGAIHYKNGNKIEAEWVKHEIHGRGE